MRNHFIKIILALFIVLISLNAFAYKDKRDVFFNQQVGIWFGPITPVGSTASLLNASLAGGVFYRYNLPYKFLKVGADVSYDYFESNGVNKLSLVPFYGSLIFQIPVQWRVKIQLKVGFGGAFGYIEPEKLSAVDPIFMAGFEISFPAGRLFNIGLRVNYLYLLEAYAPNPVGGHIIEAGITLYFNLNPNQGM